MEQAQDLNFDDIIASDDLTVIDFSATWCMPCRMLKPILERVAEKLTDVNFYNLDIDENEEIAKRYRIFSVPTLVCFRKGKKIDSLVGLNNFEEIDAMVVDYKFMFKDSPSTDGMMMKHYAPIIEYEINGKTYRHVMTDMISTSRSKWLSIHVSVDKNNPYHVVQLSSGTRIAYLLYGILFVILGIGAVVANIMELLK